MPGQEPPQNANAGDQSATTGQQPADPASALPIKAAAAATKVAAKKAAPAAPAEVKTLGDVLKAMGDDHTADPITAVRSQSFIKNLHRHIADDLRRRLTKKAKADGIKVMEEVKLFGSHKPKDADVAIVHPHNGPLMIVGVRSQMGSVGNNVLEYYQGIVGECISLQDRFPMSVIGYVYLHPLVSKKKAGPKGAKVVVDEHPDHQRYARMYNAITGRSGTAYKDIRGVYDQFAYMVVDFAGTPLPTVRDDIVQAAVPLEKTDLRISSFTDRMVETFKERHIWMDVFD